MSADVTESSKSGLAAGVGTVLGPVLGAVFGVAARVRRTKPLHPRGQVGPGVLSVTEPLPGCGVPLLEDVGEHPCTVRWSRSVGLPDPLPDIEGLAVRLEDQQADLLFSATGTGSLTRFLLLFRTPRRHGPQGTLLPVASAWGPLLFLASPRPGEDGEPSDPPSRFDLAVARGTASWERFGELHVPAWGPDEPTRFDPVLNVLPGTTHYRWVRRLREPAYAGARRGATPRA